MKKLIALSMVASIVTAGYAGNTANDTGAQIAKLQKQLKKLEKKLKKTNKKLNQVKAHDATDNIKWDVDFRTSVDSINYKMANGKTKKNSALFTNRLVLGMKYAPSTNVSFRGALSNLKAYGDSANHSQSNVRPGFADFDWVVAENATDGAVRVKEAFWLYVNDTFMGKDISWTASFGRRPSTDGLLANYREDSKAKSPLAHAVNVEFDGASFRWNIDKVTPLEGAWFKFCIGRGLTNAVGRFDFFAEGADYTADKNKNPNIDLKGVIFVPYDDGTVSVHTSYAKANDLIGFTNQDMMNFNFASKGYDPTSIVANPAAPGGYGATKYLNGSAVTTQDQSELSATQKAQNKAKIAGAQMAYMPNFKAFGDYSYTTIAVKAEGISELLGQEDSEYLENTKVFFSWAQSKSMPKAGMNMLGSNKNETGNSIWIGANMPVPGEARANWGVEYNKGSKYWRSFTYGEDTMSGSKIATRGKALEVYYNRQLTTALSMSVRYTKIDYDYTGSQSFFGEDGTPMTMTEAKNAGKNPVESSSDVRAYIRYRF
jgi:hypothetical protein